MSVCLALGSSAWPAGARALSVVGPGGKSLMLGTADLEKLTVREVDVTDPHGHEASRYRGVALSAVLALVDAPFGDALRGRALGTSLRVEAADGYQVVFSLAEIDPSLGSTDALLAFERDGKPLGADLGPFRIVVPTDKRGARWVRQVVKLSVLAPASP
jgi:hypothetical protein